MPYKTVRTTLLAVIALLTFIAEPAEAQRGRGFRSAPRMSAPRTPGFSAPSVRSSRSFFNRGPISLNSYRRYSSYRSPNGFANLFPWFFLWSATSNRGVAQEDNPQRVEATADRVVGINYGLIFTIVIVVILVYGAVMLYVGIRQRSE